MVNTNVRLARPATLLRFARQEGSLGVRVVAFVGRRALDVGLRWFARSLILLLELLLDFRDLLLDLFDALGQRRHTLRECRQIPRDDCFAIEAKAQLALNEGVEGLLRVEAVDTEEVPRLRPLSLDAGQSDVVVLELFLLSTAPRLDDASTRWRAIRGDAASGPVERCRLGRH